MSAAQARSRRTASVAVISTAGRNAGWAGGRLPGRGHAPGRRGAPLQEFGVHSGGRRRLQRRQQQELGSSGALSPPSPPRPASSGLAVRDHVLQKKKKKKKKKKRGTGAGCEAIPVRLGPHQRMARPAAATSRRNCVRPVSPAFSSSRATIWRYSRSRCSAFSSRLAGALENAQPPLQPGIGGRRFGPGHIHQLLQQLRAAGEAGEKIRQGDAGFGAQAGSTKNVHRLAPGGLRPAAIRRADASKFLSAVFSADWGPMRRR